MSCEPIKMADGTVVLANVKRGETLTEADKAVLADWVQFCRDRRAAERGEITIEQQIEQLNAAGWVAERKTRWRSPAGELFLGPHGAWKAMIAARRQGGPR